ncbi:MAG: hypothetical protein M3539_08980 [Acidobacteriota bacterium]|nr:hypothetical protein [Acidobacteriota bacterium]
MSLLESLKERRLVAKLLRANPYSRDEFENFETQLKTLRQGDTARKLLHEELSVSTNEQRCYCAIRGLEQLGITDEMVPAILNALKGDNVWIRASAANIVAGHGRNPETVVPALAAALLNCKDWSRGRIIEALTRYGPAARSATPILRASLLNPREAEYVAECISAIGTEDLDEEAKIIVTALTTTEPGELAQSKATGRNYLVTLESFLLSTKPWTNPSQEGAKAWCRVLQVYSVLSSSPSKEMISVLSELAYWPDLRGVHSFDLGNAKETAVEFVRKYPSTDLCEIIECMRNGTGPARVSAIERCIQMLAKGEEVVEALALAVSDSSLGWTQHKVVEYLGCLGADAKPALDALRTLRARSLRPLTREDFKEQETLLGGFTDGIISKIGSGESIDPEMVIDIDRAIRMIEAQR